MENLAGLTVQLLQQLLFPPWALMMFHESMMSEQVMNFQKTFEKDWTFLWLKEPKQRRLPIWVTSSVSSGSSRTRTRGLANHGFLTLSFSEFPSERKLHFWWGLSCKPADLRLRPQVTPRRELSMSSTSWHVFFCRNAAFCGKPTERSVYPTHSFLKRKT